MPARLELRLDVVGGEVVVSYGGRVLACYERDDRGLRNLAVVALSRAGIAGVKLAELFGMRPEHVSRLRRMALEGGSAALVPALGRPAKLDERGVRRVHAMAEEGRPGVEIATALGVSPATVSRVLARRTASAPPCLDLEDSTQATEGDEAAEAGHHTPGGDTAGGDAACDDREGCQAGDAGAVPVARNPEAGAGGGLARIGEGVRDCSYAGAMLLHGFFDRGGVGEVLAALPSGTARSFDAAALMLSGVFGFALGVSSAEGTKHLLHADAGALVGIRSFPHLRTLRPRLAALADAVDPLEVQVALAAAMLAVDDRPADVFFVDDHFVAYAGSAPVAKGWNTRRRHAEAGRDDTVIVDDTWRAICFASGPPSGLSKTMFGPLEDLREICGDRPVTIGFDRGGAYPKVFAELNRRGFDWVTYRRAPLATPTAAPKHSWVSIDGRRHYLSVADEIVTLDGVGAVRQISIYEGCRVGLQILTSDRANAAAVLARRLRGRWCIENTFKYLEDHHGIGWLCDYRKTADADTTKIANPARITAKAAVAAAEKNVSRIERTIGTTATASTSNLDATNHELSRLTDELHAARTALDTAKVTLRPIPAKVPATDIDPDAKRATLHTNRRAIQMVCRLLAYNAELDLARSLNTYLADPNEYRAITRHLLHQPGTIAFAPDAITVTIRRPDTPRIARALQNLAAQLNAKPPHLTGDRRPITYQITPEP